ncbi:hypothetical protein NDU88_007518 [Pleurodeles waltl]|uniref:Uncharacterized protein n=1 Tax=Pleurodeles waltl TaxID=8319 RepID=A0AAV7SSI1_PLEWA|nr:hypothetical protein NDU88_007518 [Pleurodeles waltl]
MASSLLCHKSKQFGPVNLERDPCSFKIVYAGSKLRTPIVHTSGASQGDKTSPKSVPALRLGHTSRDRCTAAGLVNT